MTDDPIKPESPDQELPTLKPHLVTLDDEQKKGIAVDVKLMIDAGIETEGRMPDWWLEVERVYRNEVPANTNTLSQGMNDPGYPEFHIPFSQPRLDMLTAQVCTVVGKQDPFMTDTSSDEDLAEKRQDLLQRVWSDARFPHEIVKASTICGNKDIAIYRVCPGVQSGTVQIDVIDPQNFTVFPALPQGIQAASLAGHRTYKRKRVIEAMQKRGEYYMTDSLPSSTQADHDEDQEQVHTGTNLSEGSPDTDNELVELWDCIVRLKLEEDDPERLYRLTLEYTGCQLLALEPYSKSYIWYFRSYFIGSPKYFWSGMSVGRNLYPLQTAYNSAWSAFFGGVLSSAKPPVFGAEPDDGQKFDKYGFGDFLPLQPGVTPFSPSIQFNGNPFNSLLDRIERAGDQVSRISQNTQGAQASGQTTATEQSIIAAGVATGLELYIANFTSDFPAMAAHTMELIVDDYQSFADRYGTEPEESQEPPAMPDLSALLPPIPGLGVGEPIPQPVPPLTGGIQQ